MDAGHRSNRKFPSYTLAELEEVLITFTPCPQPELRRQIEAEIAARKAGLSKPFITPQTR